jgi:hypothetical protein
MIKGMTIGARGGKLSLLIGLMLGVVAAALIVVYLSGAKSEGGTTSLSGPTGSVVVASQTSPPVPASPLRWSVSRSFPSRVAAGRLRHPDAVVGQVTVVPVIAGEQLIPDKITPPAPLPIPNTETAAPIALVGAREGGFCRAEQSCGRRRTHPAGRPRDVI